MLDQVNADECVFEDSTQPGDYAVLNPRIEIIDAMSVKFTATLKGPENTQVIGRAWISDEDGGMIEVETDEQEAGSEMSLVLSIPKPKDLNGEMIICARVEWPLYQTKHVVKCVLVKS